MWELNCFLIMRELHKSVEICMELYFAMPNAFVRELGNEIYQHTLR